MARYTLILEPVAGDGRRDAVRLSSISGASAGCVVSAFALRFNQKKTGRRTWRGRRLPEERKVGRMIPDKLTVEQAEHEVISAAIWRPDQWPMLQHVRPAWFAVWADRKLWGCLQFVYLQNGTPEPTVIARQLERHYPGEADGLLERLANIADGFAHVEHLVYHAQILQRAGLRRELVEWSRTLAELCESGATFREIRAHLESSPELPADLTDGEVVS